MIIKDLSGWISDLGDQVVTINLSESQDSNKYFGEVQVRNKPGKDPYVYVQAEKASFGYRYIGKTPSGI